ncbi:hypothetical protein AURDEDRAFT_111892 [Auricularia subglabra TFB-10046 SS5]|nr:hypothetical protein AURDEDRAFT_111892 [Auricularia subglabra TFB-10046 SS5]
MRSLSTSFVSLAIVLGAASATPVMRMRRAAGDPMGVQSGGEATFYNTGMGACGQTSSDGDLMAAVSRLYFDSFPNYNGANPNANPMCGKTATVTYKGKSVKVTLLDRCESCAYEDLDLSPAAFSQIASFDEGRIHGISWQLDEAAGSTPPPAEPAPAPVPAPEPEPAPAPEPEPAPAPEPEPAPTPEPAPAPEPAPEEPCPPESEPVPSPPPVEEDPCPPEEPATPPPPAEEEPCPPESQPTPAPAPAPEPNTGSGSCTDTYDNAKVYVGGDTAVYQGKTWKAKWWTQGMTPGGDVWEEAGAC